MLASNKINIYVNSFLLDITDNAALTHHQANKNRPLRSADIILMSALLHEVYSYNKKNPYDISSIVEFLK